MIKDKLVRWVLIIGLTLSAAFYLLAFFLESGTVFFIVFGFAIFMITALSAQTLYTWRKFMDDEKAHLASMKSCEHCGKPIYKDDAVCPYCKKPQKNVEDNEI